MPVSILTRGMKDKLLEYTKLAIELGKPKERFLSDPDFSSYKEDQDFLAALNK